MKARFRPEHALQIKPGRAVLAPDAILSAAVIGVRFANGPWPVRLWLGIFDAVVHKAPVGYWEEKQRGTVECRRMFSPSASGPYADAANSRLEATAAKRQGEARRGEAPAAPSRSYRRLAIMRW